MSFMGSSGMIPEWMGCVLITGNNVEAGPAVGVGTDSQGKWRPPIPESCRFPLALITTTHTQTHGGPPAGKQLDLGFFNQCAIGV